MNNEELKQLVHQASLACKEKRPYEAQELYERVLPYITNSVSKAAAVYQLGFVNRSLLGNGLEARRFFLAAVQTLKADATKTREYAWACENLMLLSLSYDEYASWAEELRKLQPDEAILREQYPSVQKDRQKGLSWSDVLTGIASGYYSRDPARVDPGLYGEAAATYHVILANRRELRLGREAWAQAVIEHVALCIRLGNDTLNFAVKHRPLLNPLPYLAIGAAARGFIDEYLESNPADARVRGLQTQLSSWRGSLEEGARRLEAFGVRPEGAGAEEPSGSTSPAVRSALGIPLALVTATAMSFLLLQLVHLIGYGYSLTSKSQSAFSLAFFCFIAGPVCLLIPMPNAIRAIVTGLLRVRWNVALGAASWIGLLAGLWPSHADAGRAVESLKLGRSLPPSVVDAMTRNDIGPVMYLIYVIFVGLLGLGVFGAGSPAAPPQGERASKRRL